jgi:hypothetical protein
MYIFHVTQVGTGPDEFLKMVKGRWEGVNHNIEALAEASREHMVKTIQSNKHRDNGRSTLENSIQVYKEGEGHFGVGLIEDMNRMAPHWKIINYGGMVAPRAQKVPGFFDTNRPPLGGVNNEVFTYLPRGQKIFAWGGTSSNSSSFMMNVKRAITGINYIEKVYTWFKMTAPLVIFNAGRQGNSYVPSNGVGMGV